MLYFKDRSDAGKQLSKLLHKYQGQEVVVYALPRGGVVVAAEIAHSLQASLHLLFAHKIEHPAHPEYAVAAVSESGYLVIPDENRLLFEDGWLENQKNQQLAEMKRKRELYLSKSSDTPVKGKIALIVDDGIATGLTAQAGIKEILARQPKAVVVAAPIAPLSRAEEIENMGAQFVGHAIPDENFRGAVGAYYADFPQVEDREVIEIMRSFPI